NAISMAVAAEMIVCSPCVYASDECKPIEAVVDTLYIFGSPTADKPEMVKKTNLPRSICAFGEAEKGRYNVCLNDRNAWVLPSQLNLKKGFSTPSPRQHSQKNYFSGCLLPCCNKKIKYL